jgi:prepilin-type processing-associated H-X9-DG protein
MILKRLITVAVLISCALVRAQEVFGNDRDTYLLMPAEAISSGVVSQVEFSKNGRYISYRRQEISSFESDLIKPKTQPTFSWYRYDRTTKVNQKLGVPTNTNTILSLGDEQTILFLTDSDDEQGFLNLRTGAVSKLSVKATSITYAGERASAPYIVVTQSDTSISLISPNGNVINMSVPRKTVVFKPIKSDANSITFAAMLNVGPAKFGHLIYNKLSGAAEFKEMAREAIIPEVQDPQPEQHFYTVSKGDLDFVITNEASKTANPVIPIKAKLTTARSFSRYSPNSDSVAYITAGALLIREIKPIDRNLAAQMVKDDEKKKAINDAKQAALSLIMCASDMDDVLPGAEGWESKVLPYSQDMDLLRRFNYTFRGGNMTTIENPASTEMGFILGPGGRAVAYVDGHVKWIPNP